MKRERRERVKGKGTEEMWGVVEIEREGREDDQHHLLFTSLPIYTLTQTESISQSPDILPTPLCEGTSPWRSLVGVGDGTHTRCRLDSSVTTEGQHCWDSPKLTFSHHTSLQGGTLPPELHTYKHPHTLPHSLSCKHVHTHTHKHPHSVKSPSQTSSQPEKSWKIS